MHDEIKPIVPRPVDDHEGQMAKSELYRAAKYSMKLFQMIDENQDLEGWVQAKITKSADYLDSVYHYMEYQMKFGGGTTASSIEDITDEADDEVVKTDTISDMDDEEELNDKKVDESMTTYEQKLQALLEGAVKKNVKGKKAEDKKEQDLDEAKIEASGVRAGDKKKGKVEKSERKQYFVKLEKDNKTRGVTTVADEGESQGEVRDRMKRDNPGWTVASIRVKDEIDEAAEKIAKAEKAAKSKKQKDEMIKEALTQVVEKAVSKAQQKFMGMVHAAKKGEKPASKEVAKTAKGMKDKDAKDFASTKHKGLPEKKKKTDESLGTAGGFNMPEPTDPISKLGRKIGKGVSDVMKQGPLSSLKQAMAPTDKSKKGVSKDSELKGNTVDETSGSMSPPDGATAAPKKDPKTGKYPKVTSGPNKGKEWSEKNPGPTNPAFKEDQDLVKSIVRKVVAEKKAGKGKPDFLDMDKDGDKKETMKKAIADKKANPFAKKDEKVKESSGKCNESPKGESCPVHGMKECSMSESMIAESAELIRMKQFLTRLNG